MLEQQSNISFVLSVAVRSSVKCCIRLTTLSTTLFAHAQFHTLSGNVHLEIIWIQKQASCLHHRGHETLEMVDGMLHSFDHPKQSSTEQGRAKASKVVCCSVKCWIRSTRALHAEFCACSHQLVF